MWHKRYSLSVCIWFQQWVHWALSQLSLFTHNSNRSIDNYFSISVQFFSPNGPSFFVVITIHQVIWPSPGTLPPGRVLGLPIRDCARVCNNCGHTRSQMCAIDVTQNIFFERLYLVPGMSTFGHWVNCPHPQLRPFLIFYLQTFGELNSCELGVFRF